MTLVAVAETLFPGESRVGGGFRAWPRNNEISSDPQAINQPSVTTRLILLTMDLSATKKQ